MVDVDTSSYPKPALPVSALDTAQKLGALKQQQQQIESGGLAIDSQKIENANKALTALGTAVTSLGPNATKEQYKAVGDNIARAFKLPPEATQSWNERIDAAASPAEFYNQAVTAIGDHQAAINYHLGSRQDINNGQQVTPSVTSVKPNFGVRPIAAPIQQQAPPTTEVATPGGTQMLGPQAARVPEGALPVQGGIPGQFTQPRSPVAPAALPVARPAVSGATGPTVDKTPVTPTTFDNRFAGAIKPSGPMTSQPPLFDEGKKAYTEDQTLAAGKMQAVKPAIQALKLMQTTYGADGKSKLSTGPGTDQFNNLTAFAKAWGITDTAALNDPTVLRQELEKKLAQYVGSNPVGQRSDAAQTLAEAGSPNPKKQILPALINLTRDAVVLDRVQAARAPAFEGNDYSKYGTHRAAFPQSIDERAFGLDLMPKDEATKLVDQMHNKYKKNPNSAEAIKFFHSLDIAKKQGFFNSDQE